MDDNFTDMGPNPLGLSLSEAVISDNKPQFVQIKQPSTPAHRRSTDHYNKTSSLDRRERRSTKQPNMDRITMRESMIVTAAKVTEKLGKIPPGAFDISNDKERTRLLRKTFVFLALDLILLGVLVFSLTQTLR
jgi:hypothetical protein